MTPPPVDEAPEPVEVHAPNPVEVHAWAEAGYMAAMQEQSVERGAYLSLARLQLRLTEETFETFIQAGADNGVLGLLDARATWRPTRSLAIRAGQFKTPVSATFGIPATELVFVHRPLHMSLVPRRALGAEVEGHVRPAGWDLSMQGGAFEPAPLNPEAGELFAGALGVGAPVGLSFHAGGAVWEHDEHALEVLGEDAPIADRHLVGAVVYEGHGWLGAVEGVAAHVIADGSTALGACAGVAHRFPTRSEALELEPAVSVEMLDVSGRVEELGQVAMNFHEADWNLMQTVEWEVHTGPDAPEHAVYVQLQVGL